MIKKRTIWKASSHLLLAFSVFFKVSAQELRPLVNINSPYNESHAVMAPFGQLFFSVGYHPENTGGQTDPGDIWMSESSNTFTWNKPQRIKELSTSGNDVVVGFPDPVSIWVYHDGKEKPKGIHIYSKLGSTWNYLRPLVIENFSNQSSHFSGRLSADGQILIMSLQGTDGFGNEDIHVSLRKADNTWSAPLNLGPTINTYAQEHTPFLSEDNRILYFSSNANSAGRGKNIFYSQRLDDSWQNWTTPKELGTANSIGSESGYASIFPDENLAIFTTTANSEGMADFMLIEFEKIAWIEPESEELAESIVAEDLVISEESHEEIVDVLVLETNTTEIDTVVQVVSKPSAPEAVKDTPVIKTEDPQQKAPERSISEDISSNKETPSNLPEKRETVEKVELKEIQILDARTSQLINYKLTLSDDSAFMKEVESQDEMRQAFNAWDWKHIMVMSKGYLPSGFSIEEWQNIEEGKVWLEPAFSGASIVLQNIQFNRGTADFADAKTIQELDRLVLFLKENQHIKVRLEGHTDNFGDPALNKQLSMNRASKIRTYLALKGIDYERIRTTGWGGSKPIADNNTEEGREINRRVELYIER